MTDFSLSRRQLLRSGTALASTLWLADPARAANTAVRTTRLVLPLAPGGAMDVLARGLAQELGTRLGTSFVVENRTGAGGNLAHEFVAGEKPDGSTLLLTSNALVANVTLFEGKVRYDPIRSFEPVSIIASTPAVIVVRGDSPHKNVADLVQQARRNGGIAVGTPGFGNGPHLTLVKLQRNQGGDWRHIPYKGAGPAVVGLLAGDTDMAIVALPGVQAYLQSGKLRVLAVLQDTRSTLAPELPTLAENGVNIDLDSGWFGLFAPAGTPPAIVARVHKATVDSLSDPGFRAVLTKQGFETVGSDPRVFAAQLRTDVERFPPLLKSIGAKVE